MCADHTHILHASAHAASAYDADSFILHPSLTRADKKHTDSMRDNSSYRNANANM